MVTLNLVFVLEERDLIKAMCFRHSNIHLTHIFWVFHVPYSVLDTGDSAANGMAKETDLIVLIPHGGNGL